MGNKKADLFGGEDSSTPNDIQRDEKIMHLG